jgi:hypothetical protein
MCGVRHASKSVLDERETMTTGTQAAREMPRYQCHKKVWALKIAKIEREPACCENGGGIVCGEPQRTHTQEAARGDVGLDHNFIAGTWDVDGATITPAEEDYAPFQVSDEYIAKHKPEVGGYFVVYDDGYKSFSPAKAFEEGYTRI